MDDVIFRRARADDAGQLTELAVASKRHWGYSEDLIDLWRPDLEFTPRSIRDDTVVVAEREDRLVGVFTVSRSGDTAELEDLWIHPSCVRRGLGRVLFQKAVEEARANGARSLVIESDPHAEPFYLRMGASPAGTVPSKPAGRRLPRMIFHIDDA